MTDKTSFPRRDFVEPLHKSDALEAVETISKPIATMLENFRRGHITAKNKEATFDAIEKALFMMRVAYFNIKHSDSK